MNYGYSDTFNLSIINNIQQIENAKSAIIYSAGFLSICFYYLLINMLPNYSKGSKLDILEKIRDQIKSYPVILYMKGTPQFPMCGFSSKAITILKRIGQPFAYINILQESEIRENMIKVSEWPTFPQLFINGELIGGCDIMEEMDEDGELAPLLNAVVWPDMQEEKSEKSECCGKCHDHDSEHSHHDHDSHGHDCKGNGDCKDK